MMAELGLTPPQRPVRRGPVVSFPSKPAPATETADPDAFDWDAPPAIPTSDQLRWAKANPGSSVAFDRSLALGDPRVREQDAKQRVHQRHAAAFIAEMRRLGRWNTA